MKKLSFLLIILISMVSCSRNFLESSINFETIAHSVSGEYLAEAHPQLYVIFEQGGINIPAEFIDQTSWEKLQGFDYNENFIVGVFQGEQSTTHEGITIEKIQANDDKLMVFAQAGPLMEFGLEAFSSPYHIISIPKSTMPDVLHIEVYFNDELVINIIE